MLAPLRTALLTAAVLLVSATSASAAATQLAPAAGSAVATAYPTFAWTVPDSESNVQLTVTPTAKLVDGNLDDGHSLVGSATKSPYVDKTHVFTPGTYFWQLRSDTSAVSSDFQIFFTPIEHFTVPAIFQFSKLRPVISTNSSNNLSEVELTGAIRCNMKQGTTKVSMQVFRGAKLLHTDTRAVGCFDMTPEMLFHNFQPRPGQIPSGTKLTLKMSAKNGAYTTAPSTVTTVKWHS